LGAIATEFRSQESINALTIVSIVVLVIIFNGGIARELGDIFKTFSAGTATGENSGMLLIFVIVVLGIVGTISTWATGRR
jgi:hypothetical protein